MTGIDWLIMLALLRIRAGHRLCPEALRCARATIFSGRPLDSGVDLRAGLHLREPGRAGGNRDGRPGAKYGIATSHFYWIGAIPAMVFVGMFMMPFYYGSKARSVPNFCGCASMKRHVG